MSLLHQDVAILLQVITVLRAEGSVGTSTERLKCTVRNQCRDIDYKKMKGLILSVYIVNVYLYNVLNYLGVAATGREVGRKMSG